MYRNVLNPSQLEAVNFNEGPLLVIAGAGSGKTMTLTCRVARMVESGVSPGSILLLTFTRKASFEMLKRASQLLDSRCEHVAGGTFHSFAHGILRRHAPLLGFNRSFSILDRADTHGLIGMLRKEMGVASKNRSFPRKQTLANIFSMSVNKVLSVEEVVSNDYPHFLKDLGAILELIQAYRRYKAEHLFFDFDDLLICLKTRAPPAVITMLPPLKSWKGLSLCAADRGCISVAQMIVPFITLPQKCSIMRWTKRLQAMPTGLKYAWKRAIASQSAITDVAFRLMNIPSFRANRH